MDMGQVQIAVGLDYRLLDGALRYLYRAGDIPGVISEDTVTVMLDEPRVELADPETNPRLLLHLQGRFALSDDVEPAPFNALVLLQPQLRQQEGTAPGAGFIIGDPELLEPEFLQNAFDMIRAQFLDGLVDNLSLPLFDSLIDAVESAYFPDDPPSRDQWAAGFVLGTASTLDRISVGFPPGHPDRPEVESSTPLSTMPALVATLALPGDDPQLPDNPSIVPVGTGLQVLISRAAMDTTLAKNAETKIGTEVEGATIHSLTMQMHDLGIEIHGKAEKSPADIDFDGILLVFFRKFFISAKTGAVVDRPGRIDIFTSGIDVDVDLPWWVGLVTFLLGFLGPIGGLINALVIFPKIDEAADAPDLVQGAFHDQITAAFQSLFSNLTDLSDGTPAPLQLLAHDAWVLGGHFAYSYVAFAGYNEAAITTVEHDHFVVEGAEGTSVGFINLDSGHRLTAAEAGQLLKSGVLAIPGYHGVKAPYGYYLRSNPNAITTDNLVLPEEIVTG